MGEFYNDPSAGGKESPQEEDTELHIQRAKNEWEATVDSLKQLILLVNDRGIVCRGNRTIERWHIGHVDQIKGNAIHDLLHPECGDEECYLASLWESASANLFRNQAYEIEAEDPILGRFLHIEFRPMGFESSRHEGIRGETFAVVTAEDISGLKITEKELRRTTSELKAVLDSLPDQYIMLDRDGTILEYSPRDLEGMTGVGYIQQGRKIQATFPAAVGELFSKAIHKVIQRQSLIKVNYQLTTPSGAQLFEARFLPMVENHIIVFNRNITDQARLESIAQSMEMMNSYGYIFSEIRHEIGNPLNSIKITISVLKSNITKFPPQRTLEYINRVLNDITRVEELLKSLKNFNMYETLNLGELSLPAFMNNLVSLVHEDFSRQGIAIATDFQSGATQANADSRALQQIMLNLLGNAADALASRNKDKTIVIGLRPKKKFTEITIADNGQGMSKSQMANLFKPFFTSKPHGTGLGLVIVKKMVSQMNGTIDVESVESEGTTVRITLPMSCDE